MGLLKTRRPAAEIERVIRAEIAAALPLISLDRCEVELAAFNIESGVGIVRFSGGCPECDASAATFIYGIEARVRLRVPELRALKLEDAR